MTLLSAIKEAIGNNGDVISGKVVKGGKKPKISFSGDKKVIIDKDFITVPKHLGSLSRKNTVYLLPYNNGKSFVVIGKKK